MKLKKLFSKHLLHLFAVVFFFLYSVTAKGQTDPYFDSLMTAALSKFDVVGASVGFVKDGKVVHCKGYGVTSVNSGNAVNELTNFGIGSNSKAFTTAALALLVDEGLINWNDKVVKYIPEFKMYDDYVTENFIIKDLLTHRSGLRLGAGDLMVFPDGTDFTIDDVLENLQCFKPVSAFRTKFDYDNLLYLVAGELIKRVSGKTWEDFVQERILIPLKMYNSYPAISYVSDFSNTSSPHDNGTEILKEIPHFRLGINGAAGSIYSNAYDMCKWLLMHLNRGRYGDSMENTLFSEMEQSEMWKLHTVMDIEPNNIYNSHFYGYGLGWFLSDVKGNLLVEHTGGLPGMLSKTLMIPDMNLGLVILTNTSPDGSALFESISKSVLDKYLVLQKTDWINIFSAYFTKMKSEVDTYTGDVWKTTEKLEDTYIDSELYKGIYEDKWFGQMEIYTKTGKLWIKSRRSPKLNGSMHYYKQGTFAVRWEYRDMNCDAFAIFSYDEKGKATGIKMKGISPNIDFSFDFQDLDFKRAN